MNRTLLSACALACSLIGTAAPVALADSDTDRAEPTVVIKDSAITSSVKARLEDSHVMGLRHVRVDTDDNGVVTLRGHTATQEAADRAVAIAKDTGGVREVRSAIEIKIDD